MIYFVAFLSGVAFFHFHDYFPFTSAALFLPTALYFFRRGRPDEQKKRYLKKARVIYFYDEGAAKVEETPGGLRVVTYVGDARLVKAEGLGQEMQNLRRLFAAW